MTTDAPSVPRLPFPLKIAGACFGLVGLLGLVMAIRLLQGLWHGAFHWHAHWPFVGAIVMAATAAACAAGWWNNQYWTRPLPIVFWLLWALYAAGVQATSRHSMAPATAFITQLPFALITWVYMYRSRRVSAYYAALPRPRWIVGPQG